MDEELDKILDNGFNKAYGSSQAIRNKLKAQLTAYCDKQSRGARIDELKRLFLVYGSKDKPASLDNLFSLGEKGGAVTKRVRERLAELESAPKDDSRE